MEINKQLLILGPVWGEAKVENKVISNFVNIANWKIIIILIILIICFASIYGLKKPLPAGISVEGELHNVTALEFVYDLTYEKENKQVIEQQIFDKAYQLIEEAEEYIVVDMFLFNSDYSRKYDFPELSRELTEKLLAKKRENPNLEITFISDEINTFYGSYPSELFEKMRNAGITVVITDLTQLRDSNPIFSGVWRLLLQWFGTKGEGWLPNAFSADSPDVTLRSYLKLLNFKANHRKVLVTETKAMVASANPHDASARHSNVAFVVEGDVVEDILASEMAVAKFSGEAGLSVRSGSKPIRSKADRTQDSKVKVGLITEGKIQKNLLSAIRGASKGDKIHMGMFYLGDRDVVRELLQASKRGVQVRLILDPNKDAFGLEKNGVPNRPVATELVKESEGRIKVRWYNTQGEQYHTKTTMIQGKESTVIIGGSANLTRRNLGDYNLESDLMIIADNDTRVVRDVSTYFDRIWFNRNGIYTVDFREFADDSVSKKLLYRFQEWSGLSSF